MPTATTPAEVCNIALGMVGQRQLIDSLEEATTEAQLCKAYFGAVRDSLIQAWQWKFATKRVALALSTETRTGWGYAYAAPADMMPEAPARVWDGVREPGEGQRIPFEVELNDAADGMLILTDQAAAVLRYTVNDVPVGLWSPAFVLAVASQLAVLLAGALPVKPALMLQLQNGAAAALLRAKALSGNSAQRDVPADSVSIRARE